MPKKEKIGRVTSDKMDKTVVVEVSEFSPHPKYKKIIQSTKNYMVNDAKSISKKGDEVKIVESRPMSKTKKWTVAEVVKQAAEI